MHMSKIFLQPKNGEQNLQSKLGGKVKITERSQDLFLSPQDRNYEYNQLHSNALSMQQFNAVYNNQEMLKRNWLPQGVFDGLY